MLNHCTLVCKVVFGFTVEREWNPECQDLTCLNNLQAHGLKVRLLDARVAGMQSTAPACMIRRGFSDPSKGTPPWHNEVSQWLTREWQIEWQKEGIYLIFMATLKSYPPQKLTRPDGVLVRIAGLGQYRWTVSPNKLTKLNSNKSNWLV